MTSGTASADLGIRLAKARVDLSGRTILHELDLHLAEQRIGILGRNGSGKSTLLRLVAGLVPATSGSVRVEGIDPSTDRKAMLRLLGILFQNPDHQILFPTVEEELAFGLTQLGQDRKRATEAARARLAAEGRAEWAKAPVSTLSQGQRHWLCLLAVLMMEPRTILLDEPLAGLDLPTQIRLGRTLAALPQRLVTITHDPGLIRGYDRVIWLEEGRIAGDGRPDQILPGFLDEMERRGAADADTDLTG